MAATELSAKDAIATLALLAQRHVNRLGDQVEARYQDSSYTREFPEKGAYERALTRLGAARAAVPAIERLLDAIGELTVGDMRDNERVRALWLAYRDIRSDA